MAYLTETSSKNYNKNISQNKSGTRISGLLSPIIHNVQTLQELYMCG